MDSLSIEEMPYKHMYGGFQLLQKLEPEEMEARLSKMVDLWLDLRKKAGPHGEQHMYHVELAHFSSLPTFKLFE